MTELLGYVVLAIVVVLTCLLPPFPEFRGVRIRVRLSRGVRVAHPVTTTGNQVRHLNSAPPRHRRLQLVATNHRRIERVH